jgi:hypothetical protein
MGIDIEKRYKGGKKEKEEGRRKSLKEMRVLREEG